MESITISQLWTVAGLLAGFQIAALGWRINREIAMEADDERTWLTLPDALVTVSFVLVVVAFVTSFSGSLSTGTVAKLLGTSLMVFAASPFVLAGHYNLYCQWGKYNQWGNPIPRDPITNQERATFVILLFPVGFGIWWICS